MLTTKSRTEQNQARVLNSLLSTARVQRLLEQTAIDGAAAYDPLDFLTDVRRGVWSEIYGPTTAGINPYRRSLQRAYVETLSNRVNGAQAQADDTRAFFRGELRTLDEDLRAAASRQADRATLLHIEDVRMQIARALDPTAARPAGGASTTLLADDDPDFDVTIAPDVCWPDYGGTSSRQ